MNAKRILIWRMSKEKCRCNSRRSLSVFLKVHGRISRRNVSTGNDVTISVWTNAARCAAVIYRRNGWGANYSWPEQHDARCWGRRMVQPNAAPGREKNDENAVLTWCVYHHHLFSHSYKDLLPPRRHSHFHTPKQMEFIFFFLFQLLTESDQNILLILLQSPPARLDNAWHKNDACHYQGDFNARHGLPLFFLLSSFLFLDIAMKYFLQEDKYKKKKKTRRKRKKLIWEFPQMSISFFCLKFFSPWYAA